MEIEKEMANFSKSDYPGLYQSADTASIKSQREYFLILSSYLISLILISSISYISLPLKINNFLLAFLFILSLSIILWLIFRKSDESWYKGRAVAESVKTRTWRWMMKAEPYNDDTETVSGKLFVNDLKQILKQNQELGELIGDDSATSEPITFKMKEIRGMDTQKRLEFYIDQRIKEQSTWYKKK